MTPQPTAPEYQRTDRNRIRRAHARHPYAYHIRRLPAALRSMVDDLAIPTGGRVLDYGCADMPYRSFFSADVEYVGADIAGNQDAAVAVRPDGTVPVPARSFDVVLSTQVLEHVRDPHLYLAECFRVLHPGGTLLLSTHGIFPYHPDPIDLWRWTCEGLRWEVGEAGFEIVRLAGVIGLAATGLQLFQDAISYRISSRWISLLAMVMQPIVALVDRFETAESLSYNAQVFALVARRPR